jgi:hypothetical protein
MMAVADKRFVVVPDKVLIIPANQVRNIHFPAFSDSVKVSNKAVIITCCNTSVV